MMKYLVTTEEVELIKAYINLLQDIIIHANDGNDINTKLKLKLIDLEAQMESLGMIK